MQYLLGATKNHEIVFAEFGVRRYGDGRQLFSASFAVVSPLNGNVSHWAGSCNDLRNVPYCSLYPEWFCIDGVDWYFASGACGQCDRRQYGMERYIDKKAFDDLMELWDQYRLRESSDDGMMKMRTVRKALAGIDEEQWITNYIRAVRAEL